MESSEKNSEVEKCEKLGSVVLPHEPTTKYMRDNNGELVKSAQSKEFGDIQSGNKENYESFVLPSHDAEFVKYQGEVGLEKPRSDVRSEDRNGKKPEGNYRKIWRFEK